MDKRLLFRGKRVDNGELVVGFCDSITKGAHLNPIQNGYYISTFKRLKNGEIILTGRYEVDPATIGQCAGLKDKNVKLIYEGDIFRDSLGLKAVVKWDEDNARFLGFTIEHEPRIAYVSRYPAVEIIGNIYENPELLEVQNDL